MSKRVADLLVETLQAAGVNTSYGILIDTQVVRQDIGFESIQEIDFNDVFKGCSVYCEMIVTPEQARRKAVAACQAALTKRGVAVLRVE
jgi:pyruvate dehydrogenase (quinone)